MNRLRILGLVLAVALVGDGGCHRGAKSPAADGGAHRYGAVPTFGGNTSSGGGGLTTVATSAPVSGDGTGGNPVTVANGALTLPKLAAQANNTVAGNVSGGSASPTAITGTNMQTIEVADTCTTQTVSGSAVQDVTFSSLSGNTDGGYKVRFFIHAAAGATFTAQPNSLTTSQAYRGWYDSAVSTTPTPSGTGGASLMIDPEGTADVVGVCTFFSKTGLGPRFYECRIYDVSTNYSIYMSGAWNESATAITSMNFHASAAGGFNTTSWMTLCKEGLN